MLNNPDAEAMIQDARESQAAAVLEVTGAHNANGTGITEGINKLARERGGEWARLDLRFTEAMIYLHDPAYFVGTCDDEIGDLVRDTADYIRHAEELAGE